jgi:hypothetical protein
LRPGRAGRLDATLLKRSQTQRLIHSSAHKNHEIQISCQHLAHYLRLPNYTNNLRRLGLTDDDLAGTGSDRLVESRLGGAV